MINLLFKIMYYTKFKYKFLKYLLKMDNHNHSPSCGCKEYLNNE